MKKMSKEEVAAIVPGQVHEIIGSVMLADGFPIVVDMARSQGQIIYDSKENKPYLDFFSYFASNPIGHNHPRMTEPEFVAKLGRAAVEKPSNSDVYTVEMAQFVATFHRVAMPDDMQHLFLISGGGLAIENAIKAAMDWKIRKNIEAGKGEIGTKVIHLKDAFHGRTGYTLTLTNTANPNKYKYYAKFDWPRISCPAAKFPLEGKNLDDTIAAEKKALEEIESIFKADADNICSFIIEPVQGEGGDNHFRPEFLKAAKELCEKYDTLYILDEIQSGMGLTGNMWAWQTLGVQPDIFAFGKKSQVCGIVAGSRIDEVEENVFVVPSRLNSTWGGNLIDMVRCQRYLEIIEEENLVENAAKMGEYLQKGLRRLETDHEQVTNARGLGLMCAFDMPDTESRDKLMSRCFDRGLIMPSCGHRTVRFRPSLNIEVEHIDRAMVIIDEALREMK